MAVPFWHSYLKMLLLLSFKQFVTNGMGRLSGPLSVTVICRHTFSSRKQEVFYLQWFPKVFSCPGLFCHSLGTPCHCPLLQRAYFPAGERHVERSIEPIPESNTTTVPHPPFLLSAQQTQGLLRGKRFSRAKLHWLSFSATSAIPRILDPCFPGVLAPQQA